MKRMKNGIFNKLSILNKGFACLFLLLFLLVAASPVLKSFVESGEITELIELGAAEEDSKAEDSKKVSELEKEFIILSSNTISRIFTIKDQSFISYSFGLEIYHPEKDSPPPKSQILA